ncbi:putative lipoprotein [Pseudomonas cannabina pv. alisalensis]|uniref:Lipoprotein n=4 Tax=Pseudomonas syringae group TaxID=136849 RepID=A0AB37QA35_PSECA|nr:putative lipoprotein [Pseudomonas cannabina pv. alisalensis]RMN76707.1 putative lipoprotein [Pseudomonas cannabina pv. alisalensis]RMN82188.1 putative lipoprotein [Pseudomonas cannabina]
MIMNALSKTVACIALAGLAGCMFVPSHSPVPKPQAQAIRLIMLAENSDGGGKSCTFTAQDDTVYLNKGDHSCTNDQMSFIKLDNVRSAMKIYLESRDCNDSGGWVFGLETYIDPVTTPWISIDQLRSKPVDTIISRGVVVIRAYDGDENIKGKLSCVRVDVSS